MFGGHYALLISVKMKRDLYWDSLKFVLIFLVVYGHIAPHYAEDSRFNMAIYNLIYLFHMPLFIFVSGRFSLIRDRERYMKGILRLLETYIVFQIIRTTIPLLLGGEFTFKCITTPNWILWYLVALIYWRLMVYFVPERILKQRKKVLLMSFCISLVAGFIPIGYPFVVQRTLSFLPFFVMGYYSSEVDMQKYINKIPCFLAVSVLVIAFMLLFFVLDIDLAHVHHGSFPYWHDKTFYTLLYFGARCIFILSAIILGIIVMRLVPTNATIAKWGCETMFIFIYHSFAVNALDAIIKRAWIPQNEFLLFVYAVIITWGLLILAHFAPLKILLNPISYYKNKKK